MIPSAHEWVGVYFTEALPAVATHAFEEVLAAQCHLRVNRLSLASTTTRL